MSYSAVVELVGIRELAEHQPAVYYQKISEFLYFVRQSATTLGVATGSSKRYQTTKEETEFREDLMLDNRLTAVILLDNCFFECERLADLVSIILKLQVMVYRQSKLLMRGALCEGSLEHQRVAVLSLKNAPKQIREISLASISKSSQDIESLNELTIGNVIDYLNMREEFREFSGIDGFVVGETAARLYGLKQRLKAVGIQTNRELVRSQKKNNRYFFQNYFATGIRNRRYHMFHDLTLGEEFLKDEYLNLLIKDIRSRLYSSKGLARFLLPVLINIARHSKLQRPKESETGILWAIESRRLESLRDLPGLELVYATVLDRVYSEISDIGSSNKYLRLRKFMRKCSWLKRHLRTDDQGERIPESVLSWEARTRFADDNRADDLIEQRGHASRKHAKKRTQDSI